MSETNGENEYDPEQTTSKNLVKPPAGAIMGENEPGFDEGED